MRRKDKTFPVDDAGSLVCDVDTLVDTRLLVQANSGGGKSYTLRYILEQTHGHVQQIVIDPEGEFSSLREKHDYVYAAARYGDTVASPRAADLLAERLLELRVSAVLDIYELKAPERVRFVKVFLDALMNAPKALWHPVLVVLDEAHVYCPQNGSVESAGSVIDLASRGRKRGFCAVIATQRLAKLHKDVAAECNNKLIGRTTLDLDLARVGDELGLGKARWRELRELAPGHFFATGPAFNVRGVVPVHVGTVRTKHPRAGARIAYTPPRPTSAIRALLPQLADLPAEAEEKKRTTDELRAEIAQLKRELAQKPKALPAPEPKVVEVQVLSPEDSEAIARIPARIDELREDVSELAQRVRAATAVQAQTLEGLSRRPVPREEPRAPIAAAPKRSSFAEGALSKGHRAILTVLAQSPKGSTKTRLALLAGYAPGGGGFNNYLGELRKTGLLTGTDSLRITPEGEVALGAWDELPTGRALIDYWLDKSDKAERAILKTLTDAYPEELNKAEVAARAGYEVGGGGFNNALGRLRTKELIVGRGELRAADALFSEGA